MNMNDAALICLALALYLCFAIIALMLYWLAADHILDKEKSMKRKFFAMLIALFILAAGLAYVAANVEFACPHCGETYEHNCPENTPATPAE